MAETRTVDKMADFTGISEKSPFLPTRFFIAIMIFVTCFVGYILNVNMSISILGMVRSQQDQNQTAIKFDLPDYGPRYDWSNSQQTLVLSAYFYGYMATLLLGGVLNQIFGPRAIVGTCIGLNAIATAFVPLAAELSFWAVFSVRVFIGAMSGIISPGLQDTIAQWAPPQEKGKFVFTLIGGSLGTVITWPMVAFLMTRYGWVYAFYVPAVLALFVAVLWFYIVSNSPHSHPRISDHELKFIEASQGNSVAHSKRGLPPICCILKSPPFYALFLLCFGHAWSFFFFLVAAPKYLNEVLKFDLTKSGILGSAPYLTRFITGFIFGSICDCLIGKKIFSVTSIRKFFCIFSHILPGILLFSLRFVSHNPYYCVAFITVALGLNGASTVVSLVNALDISPNFAAPIGAIINTFSSTAGILAPMLITFFTQEQNTVDEWNQIFFISSAMYIFTGISFMLFGSGEVQYWNDNSNKTKENAQQKAKQSNDGHF